MTRSNNYLMLGAFALASFTVSALGGAITASSVGTWYQTLNKPFFNPPDWLFGPVWTALFAAMAVAAWWVWRHGPSPAVTRALQLHGLQLALNFTWTAIFFGLQQPAAAFFQIIVFWLAVAATIQAFAQVDRWAAWLMVPYLAWISFAAALNGAIWWLN